MAALATLALAFIAVFLGGIAFSFLGKRHTQHADIMSKLKDLGTDMAAVKATVNKIFAEITGELTAQREHIAELERQLGDVDIPEEAQAEIDEFKAGLARIDALIPDPPAQPS